MKVEIELLKRFALAVRGRESRHIAYIQARFPATFNYGCIGAHIKGFRQVSYLRF